MCGFSEQGSIEDGADAISAISPGRVGAGIAARQREGVVYPDFVDGDVGEVAVLGGDVLEIGANKAGARECAAYEGNTTYLSSREHGVGEVTVGKDDIGEGDQGETGGGEIAVSELGAACGVAKLNGAGEVYVLELPGERLAFAGERPSGGHGHTLSMSRLLLGTLANLTPGCKVRVDTGVMGDLFGGRVSEIAPWLYLGGMPWATWDLAGAGISLVVNLAANLSAHAGEKEGLAEAHGEGRVGYLHWPLEDGDVPDQETLSLLVRIICDALDARRGVLVHCSAGVNRSAEFEGQDVIQRAVDPFDLRTQQGLTSHVHC